MKKRARYQGVTAFVGMPGSGKTYALAQVGLKALARGERVVCNAGFDLEGAEVIQTFDDFAALEGPAVVVWDELPLYFNARKWAEFPDSMLYKFTQIRKDGLRLYYSAIHEAMIDTNIRRITFWYWHCRAVSGRVLVRSLFPPEEFRKQQARRMRREWVYLRESVCEAYDTDRKVAMPQKIRARIVAGVPEAVPWESEPVALATGGANGGPGKLRVAPSPITGALLPADDLDTPIALTVPRPRFFDGMD